MSHERNSLFENLKNNKRGNSAVIKIKKTRIKIEENLRFFVSNLTFKFQAFIPTVCFFVNKT